MKSLRTLAIVVIMVLPPVLSSGRVAATEAPTIAATEQIHLLVGRSTVLRMDRPILRVSVSTADIADAVVTSPRELLVHGKAPGTISLLVWNENGRITSYEIVVKRDLTPLEGQIRSQFPSEPITVAVNGKDVVLSGIVSAKYVIDKASSLAAGYVEKPENIVNLLRQQQSVAPLQVMLKVRFAEVSRTAMQELGASYFTGPNGKGDWIGRGTTQQFPAPYFDSDKGLVFSDFLNLFLFNTEEQLGMAVKALKGKGLFQSLAEPNLITQDGREASFLAGGEYPYPVAQGTAGNQTTTLLFKEFGVRLKFTPTITSGGYIHLKVAPEVSALDFSNAVIMEGFRVPALTTRRTETEVELRDGQTFAVSGLMDRNMNETLRRVPGIGDIPILGYLFRSQAYQKSNTELVVMITPHIMQRDSPGVTPNLPGLVEPFLSEPNRRVPMPPQAFSGPAAAQPAGPARTVASVEPAPVAAPSAAEGNAVAPRARAAVSAPSAIDQQASARAKLEEEKAARLEADRARKQRALDQAAAREAEQRARVTAAQLQKTQSRERELEAKRAAEQGAIDRKRRLEQQEQAAQAKVVADKLAKEQARRAAEQQKIDTARLEEERRLAEKHQKAQDKLAREQAARDAELKKLITQYQNLTGEQQ